MSATLIEQLATVPSVALESRPYAFSPDGSLLAFQWYNGGDWQIYLTAADGSGAARRIGEIDDPCFCPIFSPDGRYLYFARDDEGSENFDLYRYELAGGVLENLLPDTPEFCPLPDFAVSPDGARIAMTAAHGDAYSIALMPAAVTPRAEPLEHLLDCPYTESSPSWSPDGRSLAIATGTRGQDIATIVLDVETREQRFIGGSDEFIAVQPAWSPDGHTIAFAGGPFDHPALGLFDVADGTVSWVWQCESDCHHPAWSPDGRALAFLSDEDAETSLWLLDLPTNGLRCLDVGPGTHYFPGFTRDGRAATVILSGPGHPAELFRIELEDGRVTSLTHSVDDAFRETLKERPFVGGVAVTFTSRDRLAEVPGLLVSPRKPNGAAVVIIHGGPTWHHSNEWDPVRQAFIAAGCTVLHPNYRGSDGYGRRWQLANRWLMGQGEALDCAAAADALVKLGCDPRRIAVTGRSWGGFMTMTMLTQFPGLFACGVAGVPFFDFIDTALDPAIREDLRWWDHENTGDVEKDRAKLVYYSPITHLDRIEAPVLLLGAQRDPRCPPRQIAEVAEKLRARGRVCEYVVYSGEGHEISGIENRRDYDHRTVSFILQHLGVEAPDVA
jgi:dipeptidyl aminopeptidase/acylaminoacyl peptidase